MQLYAELILTHACHYVVGGTISSFAIRSKAAVLLALVTKRQGGQLLQALLPELLRLAAEGPTYTEMVCCLPLCVHGKHKVQAVT